MNENIYSLGKHGRSSIAKKGFLNLGYTKFD
jgi:hypothetical protein